MDIATIEARLAEAQAALHKLVTGAQTVQVEYDGRRVAYSQATVEGLRTYVRDLEQRLARATGTGQRRRAIRVTF